MHSTPLSNTYVLEGRSFTLKQLKKSCIAASGGYYTGLITTYLDMYLWEVIEAIELVSELHQPVDDGIEATLNC